MSATISSTQARTNDLTVIISLFQLVVNTKNINCRVVSLTFCIGDNRHRIVRWQRLSTRNESGFVSSLADVAVNDGERDQNTVQKHSYECPPKQTFSNAGRRLRHYDYYGSQPEEGEIEKKDTDSEPPAILNALV